MSRNISAGMKSRLGSDVLRPALFVEFHFESGVERFWTGETNIMADLGDGSYTWTGGGLLGGIKMGGESDVLEASSLKFILNGVSKDYYTIAVNTDYRERPVKLWYCEMNATGTAVDYPWLLDEARMNEITWKEMSNSVTLILECESLLVDMFTARRVFHNSEDHKKVYPTDEFYSFTPTLPGRKFPWGLMSDLVRGRTSAGSRRNDFQSRP